MAKATKKRTVLKDTGDGRFTTKEREKTDPKGTVRITIKKPKKKA